MYPFVQAIDRSLTSAGICFLVAIVGAIAGLVYGWSYTFDRVWFSIWFAASLYFAGQWLWRWWCHQVQVVNAQTRGVKADDLGEQSAAEKTRTQQSRVTKSGKP
jgi:hypothetical protein